MADAIKRSPELENATMSPENEQRLRAKHPRLFGRQESAPRSSFTEKGFAVGDGWLGILDKLANEIEQACIASGRPLPIILQKHAGLTCEVCGDPGRPRQLGGVRTSCPKHINGQV
jgi:hypothetical protein